MLDNMVLIHPVEFKRLVEAMPRSTEDAALAPHLTKTLNVVFGWLDCNSGASPITPIVRD